MKRLIDMTVGRPTKNIILFSIPVLLGTLFQQLYNMTDTVIVGRFLGENALAAVGSTGSTVYFVIGFTSGLTQGFSILIAQAFGARNQSDLRKLVAHALALTLIISILITVPVVLLCKHILVLLHTPDNILSLSHSYLKFIFSGIVCTMSYNILAGILRAMGDSKTPLYFLIFSSFLNIALDICFIVVFRLGTSGVALATVISQGISAVLCLRHMLRTYTHLRMKLSDFRLEGWQVRRMLRTGIPMAMNQSITATGIMIVQSGINTFGPAVMAAYTTATKVETLVTQAMMALGSGVSTYCGQNLGAHKFDRIYRGIRQSAILGVVVACLSIVFYFCAAKSIIRVFISDPSPELLEYANLYLFTTVWFLPALAWIFVFRNALVGLGKGLASVLGGIMEMLSRMLCIQFLLPVAGFWCVRLANPITWVAACSLFMLLYFRWERKQKTRVTIREEK